MQTFFVIDDTKNLDKKIDLIINNIGSDIHFFVKAKLYTKIANNQMITKNLAGVYKNNEIMKIDEYIKSDKYPSCESLFLCYSSVEFGDKLLATIREKASYGYDSVFVRQKRSWWGRFSSWIYMKLAKFMYNVDDACCSPKIQYMSKEFVEHLKETTFCNHIFDVKKKVVVDVADKQQKLSLDVKTTFNKYYLYDILALVLILVGYVVLETFLKLPFFVYFAVFLSVILAVIVALIVGCYSKFNARSKYTRKNNE